MDENISKQIGQLSKSFSSSVNLLIALGDETRLHIILEMMKIGNCNGVRVGEITKKTFLSRPAVSHHLQILRNAGIVKYRKEGTKNYYYFALDAKAFENLIASLELAVRVTKSLPNRNENEV